VVQWLPDGRAVSFNRDTNGVSNIWAQPPDGGKPVQLTQFKDQIILNFAWSRDGRQLALARGIVINDAVLISGFR
jgi:Tol biopolymer transport system component